MNICFTIIKKGATMLKFYKYEIWMNRFAYLTLKNTPGLKHAFQRIQITDMRYDARLQRHSHTWEYKVEMDEYAFSKIGMEMVRSEHISRNAVIVQGMDNNPLLKEQLTQFMASNTKQK